MWVVFPTSFGGIKCEEPEMRSSGPRVHFSNRRLLFHRSFCTIESMLAD